MKLLFREIAFVIIIILLFVALGYVYFLIKDEGALCYSNPASYMFNNLQKSNAEALIDCSCSLIKKDASIILGINESGYFKQK